MAHNATFAIESSVVRYLRVEFDSVLYHVTSRGNAREDIFDDDADRKAFLMILVAKFLDLHYATISPLANER